MARHLQRMLECSLCSVVVVFLIISIALPIYAESIFLKDGSIVEGEIIKETDKAVDVKLQDGKKMVIARKDILRTLVSDSYKTKMYIMKGNKDVVPVYVVDEDNESYTCRIDLGSADEFRINKKDVIFISKIPPKDVIDEQVQKIVSELAIKKQYTREQNLKWRAPFLRFGYSNIGTYIDSDIRDAYSEGREINVFIDIFPWRFRNESGNGFDVMTRIRSVASYDEIEPVDKRTQLLSKLYQVSIEGQYKAELNIDHICGGLKYTYSMFYGIVIQPYVYGLLLYVFDNVIEIETLHSDHFDENIPASKFGYQIGAGIDFGLTPYFGVFVEGMYSYIGAKFKDGKTRNVDGYYVYYGVTWRTSYGLIE